MELKEIDVSDIPHHSPTLITSPDLILSPLPYEEDATIKKGKRKKGNKGEGEEAMIHEKFALVLHDKFLRGFHYSEVLMIINNILF